LGHRHVLFGLCNCCGCLAAQLCPTVLRPHGLWPARLLCPWSSPGKNTGVGCHSLLQGIFLTQGSNLSLLHCRQILHHLSHQGRAPFLGAYYRPRTTVGIRNLEMLADSPSTLWEADSPASTEVIRNAGETLLSCLPMWRRALQTCVLSFPGRTKTLCFCSFGNG